jgi:PKD domain
MKWQLIFLGWALPMVAFAQINENYILLGDTERALIGPIIPKRYKLDFSKNIPALSAWENMPICSGGFPLGFANVSNAFTVSDTLAHFYFTTNGRKVIDENLSVIPNAHDLWQEFQPNALSDPRGIGEQFYLLPINDSAYQLIQYSSRPKIGNMNSHPANRFLLFHEFIIDPISKKVRLTVKDSVVNQYFGMELSAPTRHANGRDWFFVLPNYNSITAQGYFGDTSKVDFFRFETWRVRNGVIEKTPAKYEQSWSWKYMTLYTGVYSQKGYSPDGSKFYLCDVVGCFVFDFDRCTGQLSNREIINVPSNLSYQGQYLTTHGVNISPNDRFLYMTFTQHFMDGPNGSTDSRPPHYILQYDLEATNLEASIDTIATTGIYIPNLYLAPLYDTFATNYGEFKSLTYGIDGKLWVSSGWDNLSYIEYPDSAGQACGFKSRAIVAPMQSTHWRSFNQRLGPLDNSPCDTLGINNDPHADFRWKSHDCLTVKFRNTSWHEPTNFHWDFGDGTTSTEREPVHTYTKGVYQACLLASNQYGSHAFCREIDLVNCGSVSTSQPQQPQGKAVMSPNPTDGPLQLTYQLHANHYDGLLRFYDMQGRLAFAHQLSVNKTSYLFDIGYLSAGLYFWSLTDGAGLVSSGKVVKIE